MSKASVRVILERIAVAGEASAIAVFDIGAIGYADAVFADTVRTRRRLEGAPATLVGVFHGGMPRAEVLEAITLRLSRWPR